MDALPSVLDGLERRESAGTVAYAAAWGDPPVVLRCGVPKPAALRPTSQLFGADGVFWLPVETTATWVFTTIGRQAYVEVTVPKRERAESGPLVDLAAPIKRTVPEDTP